MKKFKIEYLLYIFIILCPILDASSFLFRKHFPNVGISPSTIIRPLIPLILLLYVFFKDKKVRKYLVISALIYILYGGIHLYIYYNNIRGCSYGSLLDELQYVVNYTYMIYVMFLYLYFSRKGKLDNLNKSIYISLGIYLFIIFISIVTGTSSSTYVEGMGYKGWFLQGNTLCTVLLLIMCIILPDSFKNKKWYKFVLIILLGIYLLFLIGTRTGMLGFILVLGFFIGIWFINYLKINKKINYKILGITCGFICALGCSLIIFGSATFERRKHIANESAGIIDINTMEVGHTTGDTGVLVKQIKDNVMEDNYMSDASKKAYLRMYDYANKKEISANDKRYQQLLYHTYLIKEEKSITKVLFGNGYLNHYSEMVLEMELVALLYNFGIIGFILYFGPFLYVFIKSIRKSIKNKKIDVSHIMYIFAFVLATLLSFMAGYVFFSASCVMMIICNMILLEGDRF